MWQTLKYQEKQRKKVDKVVADPMQGKTKTQRTGGGTRDNRSEKHPVLNSDKCY